MNITIGINVAGYTEYRITDDGLLNAKDSHILVYLDMESNAMLIDYYKGVRSVLRNTGNKLVLLLNEDDNSDVAQAITHLCLEYGCYNVYQKMRGIEVNTQYVDSLFARESSQDEVKMFVSPEGAAYATISEALIKITECVIDNKIDELQDYIIQNRDLVKQYPAVLSYMRQHINEMNFGIGNKVHDLEEQIKRLTEDKQEVQEEKNKLHGELLNLQTVVRQREEENNKVLTRISSYEESITKLKREKEELVEKAKVLEASSQSVPTGDSPYTNYQPVKLTQIKGNRIRTVIYIKEVTRPKYINTFTTQFFNYLSETCPTTRGKVKLIIYDNKVDLGILYNPLTQVNSNNYFEQKANIVNSNMIVFTDPNPAYLTDLATHSKAEYLVFYDRLGRSADLVYGDAVIKYYTFASKKDLINFKSRYNDIDESRVIMNPAGVANTLEIAELDGFSSIVSAPARFAKYFKMPTNRQNAMPLFRTITSKCGL